MTGQTDVDTWYNTNYFKLKNYCEKYKIEEDKINDTYLKLKKIEYITGLTESELFMYVRKSLWNLIRDEHKKTKRRGHNVSIEDVDYNTIEAKLNELEHNSEDYHNELQWLTKKMFEYIDQRGIFTDYEVFILKSYVWTDVTYAELEEKIGISQDICKKTMRKFRQDLRFNFLRWLNNDHSKRS